MNRSRLFIGGALAAALVAGGLGIAQASERGCRGPHERHAFHGGMRHAVHHGVERKIHRMVQRLELSDEQRDAVWKIVDAKRTKVRQAMREMRQTRQAIRKQSHADTFDADKIAALAKRQGQLVTQLALAKADALRQIRTLFTEEQLEEFKKLGNRSRHGRGFRHQDRYDS